MNGRAEESRLVSATAVLRQAIARGYFDAATNAIVFHDLDRMCERIHELKTGFPPATLHTVAIKANPLVEILKVAVETGAGLEAASMEEIHIGLAAGCPPERMVFDSPAKTMHELKEVLRLGVKINADNFTELERVAAIHTEADPDVGLRINPLVGAGSIATTSVATATSRFGVPLEDPPTRLVEAFRHYPWLSRVHVHVGSQGCPLELLVAAVERVYGLCQRLNTELGRRQVTMLDIGGGLPVTYVPDDEVFTLTDYVDALQTRVPGLIGGDLQLATEFGRFIQAGCGWAVSRVEYIKKVANTRVAVIHLGADFLMRPVYQSTHWRHRYIVLDGRGRRKSGSASRWTIAGPLCFAGDILAPNAVLPEIEAGDLLMVCDVGAYTLSMWSRHCNRGIPMVVGYTNGHNARFRVLRARETPQNLAQFWGVAQDQTEKPSLAVCRT